MSELQEALEWLEKERKVREVAQGTGLLVVSDRFSIEEHHISVIQSYLDAALAAKREREDDS